MKRKVRRDIERAIEASKGNEQGIAVVPIRCATRGRVPGTVAALINEMAARGFLYQGSHVTVLGSKSFFGHVTFVRAKEGGVL
jgi:hypothetical protein